MNYFKFFSFFFVALLFMGCKEEKPTAKPKFDLDKIQLKGKITVLIDNSSLSFFELRGKNMGFEYEILDSFAKSIGLKMEVKVIQNQKEFLRCLNNGEGDIIACNQAITLSAKKNIDFSIPFYKTHQVLIQRKNVDSLLLKEAANLANKEVYITKDSPFEARLKQLSD